MTGPVGEVRADLVIDSSKTEKTLREGLDDVGEAIDRDLEDTADVWGETLADGLGDKLKKSAPDIASMFGAALDRENVRTKMTVQFDRDRNVVRGWLTTITEPLKDAITTESAKGASGAFGPVGTALGDAIGSAFNISGRSPLIYLLIPVIGYIGALIVAAIQAVSGLAAVLLTLPNAIAAIGLQVGVLMLAWEGMGAAIQGAFAAENAWELQEAIKDLTPSAQEFVKQLLPLEPIFKGLQKIAQEGFFGGFMTMDNTSFGTSIERLTALLQDPVISSGIQTLATGLGKAADIIVGAFSSPEVKELLALLLPSAAKWVTLFALSISELLGGFAALGVTMMPFFEWLGNEANAAISSFGNWLKELSEDKGFLLWLEDMKVTLKDLFYTLGQFGLFIGHIFRLINEAGGTDLIRTLGDQIAFLNDMLDDEAAVKGFEGLIHVLELLSWIFILFIYAVFAAFTGLELVIELLAAAFTWVGEKITGFFEGIGTAWDEFWDGAEWDVTESITNIMGTISLAFAYIYGAIVGNLENAMHFVRSLPGRVVEALGNLGSILYHAGASMIQGLIDGMLSKLGPLGVALDIIFSKIGNRIPHSPAKEGPLSGAGDPMKGGQTIVDRLATGMEMETGRLSNASDTVTSNIIFGAGAIQNSFYGPPPSQSQATGIGSGIGTGISGILAQRDTRLTVRAMA